MDLQTQALHRLTDNAAVDRFPSFSPDGLRILFRSERDGQSEIYEVGADGSGLRRLTNDPGYDAYPTYSPDGRWILFQSNRGGQDAPYLLDPASLVARPVTDGSRVLREPRYTPDGLRLVVSSTDPEVLAPRRQIPHVFELTLPLWAR